MSDAVIQSTNSRGQVGGYRLRLLGYKKTFLVSLVNAQGEEAAHHFLSYNPDDPVESLLFGSCTYIHHKTAGILFPCAIADLADENRRGEDPKRLAWRVEFAISEKGYQRAVDFIDKKARKWNFYHVRNRNCITFAHRVAKEAGLPVPRPLIQRPRAFADRLRGAIRRGRLKPLAATLPPGRIWGPLPEDLVPLA